MTSELFSLQVWQAIEKVLLEDSMVGGTNCPEESQQLTELSPVPQLHLSDTDNLYCHNQEYDTGKVRRNTDQLRSVEIS